MRRPKGKRVGIAKMAGFHTEEQLGKEEPRSAMGLKSLGYGVGYASQSGTEGC